jgi:hypothetical protein
MRSIRIEALAAVALAVLAVLTAVWPEWIEAVFGADPDRGSGAAEAVIVIVCALAAAGLWMHRRVRLRRGSAPRCATPKRARPAASKDDDHRSAPYLHPGGVSGIRESWGSHAPNRRPAHSSPSCR